MRPASVPLLVTLICGGVSVAEAPERWVPEYCLAVSLAPAESGARSGPALDVYTTRLGWILERVSGRIALDEVERAPWRILGAGYVPLDAALADRLDWLVSQYLLEENLAAADDLAELQRRIRGDPR